jgi:hypothetical protein
VIYLVGVEFVALGHVCLWCASMHALIVATLLLLRVRTPHVSDGAREIAIEMMGPARSRPSAGADEGVR